MSVSNYKARFYELSRYALSTNPIEFERIQCFAKGLAGYLQEATTSLVLARDTFYSVGEYVCMIEHIKHNHQGGMKRFHRYDTFNGHTLQDIEFQRSGHLCRAVHATILIADNNFGDIHHHRVMPVLIPYISSSLKVLWWWIHIL